MPTLAQELPGLGLGLGAWTSIRRTPEPWASPGMLLGTASRSSDWHPWSAKRSASTIGQLLGRERCCMSSRRLWNMVDLPLPIHKLGAPRASSSHPTSLPRTTRCFAGSSKPWWSTISSMLPTLLLQNLLCVGFSASRSSTR